MTDTESPYGQRSGGGLTLPEDYRPTPSVKSRNVYCGGTEHLGPGEMRVSFLGSIPWPPTRSQSMDPSGLQQTFDNFRISS